MKIYPAEGGVNKGYKGESMKTIVITDRPIDLAETEERTFYRADKLGVVPCTGCMTCQFQTPGRCVYEDEMKPLCKAIQTCDELIIVSHITDGMYDLPVLNLLSRTRPLEKPFYKKIDEEVHHVMRGVRKKTATVVGYGGRTPEENEMFKNFVRRTVYRFNIISLRVFATRADNVDYCLSLGENAQEDEDDE